MEYNSKAQSINTNIAKNSGSAFSLQDFFTKLRSLWLWILLSVIACTALAFIYYLKTSPQYKIHATVLVQDEKKGSGILATANAMQNLGGMGTQSNVDNEALVLKTRTPMAKTVWQLQLFINYFSKGKIKKTEIYGDCPVSIMFADYPKMGIMDNSGSYEIKINKTAKTFAISNKQNIYKGSFGDSIKLPEGTALVTMGPGFANWSDKPLSMSVGSFEVTVEKYMSLLTTELPNKQTSIINLTLIEGLPDKGEVILNEFLNQYLKANLEDKNLIADSTVSFINERLAFVAKELSGVERNIEDFKTNNKLTDISVQSKLLMENSSKNAERQTELKVQYSVVDELQSFLKDNLNDRKTVPSSMVINDPSFFALIKNYNDLQLDRDKKLMSQTQNNPAIITMDLQLYNLRQNLLSSIGSIKRGVQTSISELGKYTSGFESQIGSVPEKERRLIDYNRQQTIKNDLYVFLLTKREETAVSKASNIATTRILDAANSEVSPFKPSRTMILFSGFLIGLALPFGFSYARQQLGNKVNSIEDITNATSAPIFAQIGHNKKGNSFAISGDATTKIAEDFRTLCTHLQHMLPKKNNQTILVTSSMAGEGKSFISINLAQSLSLAHKKVVLLELDLREPTLKDNLALAEDGFTNYIIKNDETWKQYLQQAGADYQFDVLCAGAVPTNPTVLLQLPKVKVLIQQLQETYDYVIIDTPSVGLITDTEILAPYADLTLFIIRHKYTLETELNDLDDLYQKKMLPNIHLIVNDLVLRS